MVSIFCNKWRTQRRDTLVEHDGIRAAKALLERVRGELAPRYVHATERP